MKIKTDIITSILASLIGRAEMLLVILSGV